MARDHRRLAAIITTRIAYTARSMARHPRNVAAHPYLLLPRLVVTLGSSIAAVSSRHQLPLDWQFAPHKQVFQLSLQTSLAYGRIPSGVGVIASIICALMIDKVGRKP